MMIPIFSMCFFQLETRYLYTTTCLAYPSFYNHAQSMAHIRAQISVLSIPGIWAYPWSYRMQTAWKTLIIPSGLSIYIQLHHHYSLSQHCQFGLFSHVFSTS